MKLRRRHKKQHGTKTTLGLVIILVLILLVIWSEFNRFIRKELRK